MTTLRSSLGAGAAALELVAAAASAVKKPGRLVTAAAAVGAEAETTVEAEPSNFSVSADGVLTSTAVTANGRPLLRTLLTKVRSVAVVPTKRTRKESVSTRPG